MGLVLNQVLQTDPTRTTTLRKQFTVEMNKRFRKLKKDIFDSIVTNDAFGIGNPNPFTVLVAAPPGAFNFPTDAAKVAAFQQWLQQQIDDGILEAVVAIPGTQAETSRWMNTFIQSAYQKGISRGQTELERAGVTITGEEGFVTVRPGFGTGVQANRLFALQTRAFNELKGITDTMAQQITRELSQGFIEGVGPREIARRLNNRVDAIGRVRANTLARTEIIRAHHQGNIDTLEAAGVEGVVVLAEWSTAGDDRVCPNCEALEGVVFTLQEIRGLIPLHPNCRCVAIPAGVGEKVPGRKGRRFAEDIPQEEIVQTAEETQSILDVSVKESERIELLHALNSTGKLKKVIAGQERLIGKLIAQHNKERNALPGPRPVQELAGSSSRPGLDGPLPVQGLDGTNAPQITAFEKVGDDVLIFMSNGTGFRLNDMVGHNGKDAVGLKDVIINKEGELIINLTDGKEKNLGKVEGQDGEDGVDGKTPNVYTRARIVNNNLIMMKKNGDTENLGRVVAPALEPMEPISIEKITTNEEEEMVVILTNGHEENLGRFKGSIPAHQVDPIKGIRFMTPGGLWGKWFRPRVRGRGGFGGLPEAPIDGKTYGRKNEKWVEVNGGGLSTVITDVTLTGDGSLADPLGAIGVHRYSVEDGEILNIPDNYQFDHAGCFEIIGGILEVEGRMVVH